MNLFQKLKKEFEDNWCDGHADDEDWAMLAYISYLVGVAILGLGTLLFFHPVIILWVLGIVGVGGVSTVFGFWLLLSLSRLVNAPRK